MTTSKPIPNLTPEQAVVQARILQEGSARDTYQFACHHPGADIPALQARLLSVCDGRESYLLANFAKDVDGADISSLQARILEIGFDFHALSYARDIPGADIPALQALVLHVGEERKAHGEPDDGVCLLWFARSVRGADISSLQARVLEVGDSRVLFEFARDVPGADVPALYERAVQRGFNSCGDDSIEIEFGFETLVSYYQTQRKWTETDADSDADSDEAAPTESAPSPA